MVEIFKEDMRICGQTGTILVKDKNNRSMSDLHTSRSSSDSRNRGLIQYSHDFDFYGLEDNILIGTHEEYGITEFTYSLYYSTLDSWTDVKRIELGSDLNLISAFVKNSTIIFAMMCKCAMHWAMIS